MKRPITLTLLILSLALSSCKQQKDNRLDHALEQSGNNRKELESVLNHYSANPEDSLKLRAAVFLIENMPGHYTYEATWLDEYVASVDKDPVLSTLPWDMKNIFRGHAYRLDEATKNAEKKFDIEHITAQFLIDNIESAFESWEHPWAKHLTFDEFCEYILPYRIEHEPLINWRDSLRERFSERAQWLEKIDEYHGSSFWAAHHFNEELIAAYLPAKNGNIAFSNPLFEKDFTAASWGCSQFVYGSLFALRAAGVPVGMDFIPQWAARKNPHYWNIVLNYYKHNIPFMGYETGPYTRQKPDMKMVKVYRRTFARNPLNLCEQNPGEPMPPFFENPFFRDVTPEYMNTTNLEIELRDQPEEPRKIAYLCVFDNREWNPVDWGRINGGRVTFERVGTGIVCMAGYWIDDELVPASHPFHIDHNGNMNYIIADKENLITLTLDRKFPMYRRIATFGDDLIGGYFEVSNTADFSRRDTLFVIDTNPYGALLTYHNKTDKAYRYIRFCNPKKEWVGMAEFEVYGDGQKELLSGKLICSEAETRKPEEQERMYDNQKHTYMRVKEWAGYDLGHPVQIDSIRYLSRNDDNTVVRGELYELFYADGPLFRSMGRKVAEEQHVTFDSVPSGTLYWLRDHSKGREERIFTLENERIVFW